MGESPETHLLPYLFRRKVSRDSFKIVLGPETRFFSHGPAALLKTAVKPLKNAGLMDVGTAGNRAPSRANLPGTNLTRNAVTGQMTDNRFRL
jgi:hypothetical protein